MTAPTAAPCRTAHAHPRPCDLAQLPARPLAQAYATSKGIKVVGDMPIYVGGHSADVWANRNLFELNDEGKPDLVSGVPPDAFSATGEQRQWQLQQQRRRQQRQQQQRESVCLDAVVRRGRRRQRTGVALRSLAQRQHSSATPYLVR